MRKFIRYFVALVILGFTLLIIISCVVGDLLLSPASCEIGHPPTNLPATSITFKSKSGSTISGWHINTPHANATVILVHPIRGNRRSMLSRAELFYEAGYSVLMIDLQAHGESSGNQITLGYLEKYDVIAAVNYVRSINPMHRIAIVGRSLGGAAAVLASPIAVDALVLESVYPNINDAIHNRVAMRVGQLSYFLSPFLVCQLKPRLGISTSDLMPIDMISKTRKEKVSEQFF